MSGNVEVEKRKRIMYSKNNDSTALYDSQKPHRSLLIGSSNTLKYETTTTSANHCLHQGSSI